MPLSNGREPFVSETQETREPIPVFVAGAVIVERDHETRRILGTGGARLPGQWGCSPDLVLPLGGWLAGLLLAWHEGGDPVLVLAVSSAAVAGGFAYVLATGYGGVAVAASLAGL